ncbi:MAG: hypothetical protein ACR2NQ_02620 [Thermodesulfobacteriota bacterium]
MKSKLKSGAFSALVISLLAAFSIAVPFAGFDTARAQTEIDYTGGDSITDFTTTEGGDSILDLGGVSIPLTGGESGTVTDVWTEGDGTEAGASNTIDISGNVSILTTGRVFANSSYVTAINAPFVDVNGAAVWANGSEGTTAIYAESVNISNGTIIYSNASAGGAKTISIVTKILGIPGGSSDDGRSQSIGTDEVTGINPEDPETPVEPPDPPDPVDMGDDATGDGNAIVNIGGSDIWANGTEATTISSYEAGLNVTVNSVSANIWADGDSASAIETNSSSAVNTVINLFVSNVSTLKGGNDTLGKSVAINTTALSQSNTVVNAVSSNVWAAGANSSAIDSESEFGGSTTLNLNNTNVWTNGSNSVAISTRVSGKRGTGDTGVPDGTVILNLNGASVQTIGAESTAVEILTDTASGSAYANISNARTRITTGGDNSNGVVVLSDTGGTAGADINASRVTATGDNSTGIMVGVVDGYEAAAAVSAGDIGELETFAVANPLFTFDDSGTVVVNPEHSSTALANGTSLSDYLTSLGESATSALSNGVSVANVVGGAKVETTGDNSISALVSATDGGIAGLGVKNGGEIGARGDDSTAIKLETKDVDGSSQLTYAIADLSGAKVWTHGDNSIGINAAVPSTEGFTSVSINHSTEVWTNGTDSIAFVTKDSATVNGSKVWSNGATSNAIVTTAATAHLNINSSQVWTDGDNSNAIVTTGAATVNVVNGSKVGANGVSSTGISSATGSVNVNGSEVWANGTTSRAINSRTVTINGASDVWTTGGGSFSSRTQTIVTGSSGSASVYGGSQVWSNGAFAETINSRTVTVNGAGTEVWAAGSSGDAIVSVGGGRVNVYGGSKVWTNGEGGKAIQGRGGSSIRVNGSGTEVWTRSDDSQTVFVRDGGEILIENEAKVWSNGGRTETLYATGSTSSIKVNGAEVWEEGGRSGAGSKAIQTVLGASVDVENNAKVWSNSAASDAIFIGQGGGRIDINGSQVWSVGGTSNAISATGSTVNVVNGSKVGANGVRSNGILGRQVNVNSSQVWANGTSSQAINATTVTINGGSNVWTQGGSAGAPSQTIGSSGSVGVYGASKVWSNGASAVTINSSTVTVDGTGTEVWSAAAGSYAALSLGGGSVSVYNGAKVWANTISATAIETRGGSDVRVNGSGTEVWSTGGSTWTVYTRDGGEIIVENGAKVWSNGSSSEGIYATGSTSSVKVNNAEVWREGRISDAIRLISGASVDVENNAKVWANGAGGAAITVTTFRAGSVTVNGSQVWAEGTDANGIFASASHVDIFNESKVWTNRSSRTAVRAQTATVDNSDVWTDATGYAALAIGSGTTGIYNGSNVWANMIRASSVAGGGGSSVIVNGSNVWTLGADTNAVIVFERATIENGAQVWSNGSRSRAVAGNDIIVNGAEVWTEGGSSISIQDTIPSTASFGVTVTNGAKVWANGTSSSAITGRAVTVRNSEVWSEGETGEAINGTKTVTESSSKVWSNGAGSRAVIAQSAFINSSSSVWTHNGTDAIRAATAIVDGGAQVWTNTSGITNAITADTARVYNGAKVWAVENGGTAIAATVLAVVNGTGTEVWAQGSGPDMDAVAAGTAEIVSGAKVWINGAASSAVFATGTATVNGAQVWTESAGNGVDAQTARIFNKAMIWANGGANAAITSFSGSVFVDDSSVWSDGGTADGIFTSIGTVEVYNGSNVWTNRALTAAIVAERGTVTVSGSNVWAVNPASSRIDAIIGQTIGVFNGSEVWANGSNPKAINAQTGSGQKIIISDSTVWSQGLFGITVVGKTASAFVNSSNVSARSTRDIAIWVLSADVTGSDVWSTAGTAIWVEGTNLNVSSSNVRTHGIARQAIRAPGASVNVIGANVWATGDRGEAINARNVNITSGSNVLTNGIFSRVKPVYATGHVNVDASMVSTGGHSTSVIAAASVNVTNGSTVRKNSYSSGDGTTISATGRVVVDDSRVQARGPRGVGIIAPTADIYNGSTVSAESVAGGKAVRAGTVTISGGSTVWSHGRTSNTIEADTVSITGGGKVRSDAGASTNGIGSGAYGISSVAARTADITITGDGTGEIWTHGTISRAAKVASVFAPIGGTATVRDVKVWSNSAGADAIRVQTNLVLSDVEVWTVSQEAATVNASTATGGDVSVTVANGADVTARGGARAYGIYAESDGGEVAITLSGSGSRVSGSGVTSRGIYAKSDGGSLKLEIGAGTIVNGQWFAVNMTGTGAGEIQNDGEIDGDTFMGGSGDIFNNTGTFAGVVDMGGGADTFNNLGSSVLTLAPGATVEMDTGADTFNNEGNLNIAGAGALDFGAGDDTFNNPGNLNVAGATGALVFGAGADTFNNPGDLKLDGAAGLINFGAGTDTLETTGTLTVSADDTITGLERALFRGQSILAVDFTPAADEEGVTVAGAATIFSLGAAVSPDDLATSLTIMGTSNASAELDYTLYTTASLSSGNRDSVLARVANIMAKVGGSARFNEDFDLLIRFSRLASPGGTGGNLLPYDAFIQSAWHTDRAFASKLRARCGSIEGEVEEMAGGGCAWATTGSRSVSHKRMLEYKEDVFTFSGGISIPFAIAGVTIAGGYETSNFDIGVRGADVKTKAEVERFMVGVGASRPVANLFIADVGIQVGRSDVESNRVQQEAASSPRVRALSSTAGIERVSVVGGIYITPRLELGLAHVAMDSIRESGFDGIAVEGENKLFIFTAPSIEFRYPAQQFVDVWAKAGSNILLNKTHESLLKIKDDPTQVDGTLERSTHTYGGGMEFNFSSDGAGAMSASFEYDGGMSSSFKTFVHSFTGRLNLAF